MDVKLGRNMWAPFERFSQLVKCAAFPGKERTGSHKLTAQDFPNSTTQLNGIDRERD